MDSLSGGISARTLAVVACPQFGIPFNMQPLEELCGAKGVPLVDDAAQAMDARAAGGYAGLSGDAGIFSFSRSKPMTSVEGGALLTNNDALAKLLEDVSTGFATQKPGMLLPVKALVMWFMRHPALYRIPARLPWLKLGASIFEPGFKRTAFSSFQAGMAAWSLERLENINRQRMEKAMYYKSLLQEPDGLKLIAEEPELTPIYIRFPVLPAAASGWGESHPADNPEAKRLGIIRGFPLPLDRIAELRQFLDAPGDYPGARRLARDLITLPTHDQVKMTDCAAAVRYVSDFIRERRP
jgi:dTDP-4-amino-4,6-dideoxygalactose transaminase